MFVLSDEEWQNLKSQNVISSWGGTRSAPGRTCCKQQECGWNEGNGHRQQKRQGCFEAIHRALQICQYCYPTPWKKTADEAALLTSRQKTDLAAQVGDNIAKAEFEAGMPIAFQALSEAWEKAHQ